MIPLLILRAERGAEATARRARALGLSPIIRSLFKVEALAWNAPEPELFDALLLTSANAVRYGDNAVRRYAHLPVFAVGKATAKAAEEAGFENINEGSSDAADALTRLARAGYTQPLHLAGEARTPYPPIDFDVTTCTVYAARPTDVALPTGRYVALVHSARAAIRFTELCPSPTTVDIVAISQAVAQAAGPHWHSITIAATPDDDAMLALAAPLCDGVAMPTGHV